MAASNAPAARATGGVLVVGGGVAGLTLARTLRQLGVPCRVFDGHSSAGNAQRFDRGLGLWNRAQAVLRKLGLASLLDDETRVRAIPPAAYRSRGGAWLSECTKSVQNLQRVCTLRQSLLLHELQCGLPEDCIEAGATVIHTSANDAGVVVRLSDGRAVSGDVLVGADGCHSVVRTEHFEQHQSAVQDSGFVTVSGVLSTGCTGDEYARPFETLAGGGRFALVPLAGEAAFWFATHPTAALGPFLDTARPPLLPGGFHCSAAELFAQLRSAHAGWHSPIKYVLHAAACAASEHSMRNFGRSDSEAGSPAACVFVEPVYKLARPPMWWKRRVVLVGDAAHYLPANLAQGASAAIEGAYLLGVQLGTALSANSAQGQSRASDLPAPRSDASLAVAKMSLAELETKFCAYQGAHAGRIAQCELVTAFTEVIARPASPVTEAVRNAMRLVPRPLNGWVFDTALDVSLGELPSRTRLKWTVP